MALYDFKCKDCDSEYVELSKFDESGTYPGVLCPQCGSDKKEKLMSIPAALVPHDSHDWQYNNKLPQAIKEREMAERAYKMGAQPYNHIDDINTGDHFGTVK